MNDRSGACVATLSVLLSAIALGGCASVPLSCAPPARMMASAELVFGRNIDSRVAVSDADFARFLADEVTPRFPDGLTVIDARGQWRDSARGVTVREPSKVLQLVFDNGDAQKRADLGVIAEAYKTRFRQQSVMTVVRSACVGF